MSFSKDTYWHISTALNPDKYGMLSSMWKEEEEKSKKISFWETNA